MMWTMAKLKRVKCGRCHRKYNPNKVDVIAIANDCPSENCDLRSPRYKIMMDKIRDGQREIVLEIPKDDLVVIEVDDVIVVRTDAQGNERSVP